MELLEINVFKLTDFKKTGSKKNIVKFNRSNIKRKTNYTINLLINNRKNWINKLILKPNSKINIFIYILNYVFLLFYINLYIFIISFHNNYIDVYKLIISTEILWKIIFILDYILNLIKQNIKNKQIKLPKELIKYYSYYNIYIIIDTINLIPLSLIFILFNINYVYFNIYIFFRYSKIYFFFDKEKFKIIKNILFKRYFYDPLIIKVYYLVIILWIYILFFINLRVFIVKLNPNNNWIFYDFENYNMTNLFIISFYWVIQTIFTIGYGDILNYNKSEILVSMLCMILGVCIYSLLISCLLNIKNRKFLKNIIKFGYLRDLAKFTNYYNLNRSKYYEIKSFINKNE